MRSYPIFCPVCDELILDAPACPHGHWTRSNDTAEVGQFVGEALPLPLKPEAGLQPVVVGNQSWLAGMHEGAGALLSLQWSDKTYRTYPLPAGKIARGLCVAHDVVITSLNDSGLPVRGKIVLALDGAHGTPTWQRALPEAATLSAPAYEDDMVYVLDDEGRLYTLDIADGKPQRAPLLTRGHARHAPVVHHGWVFLSGSPVQQAINLSAVDVQTGRTQWQLQDDDALVAPVLVTDRAVFAARIKSLVGLDRQTGKSLWPMPYRPRETSKGAITSPCLYDGTRLLFGGGELFDGQPGYALHAVNAATGAKAWSYRLNSHLELPPVSIGDLVVCVDRGGTVVALNMGAGQPVWQAQLPAKPLTALLVIEDFIVLIDKANQLHTIRYRPATARPTQSPESYVARQEWQPAAVAYALRGNLGEAGQCLLKAGDARHALKLFEWGGHQTGRAQALTALREWDQAINLYRDLNDPAQVAEVLAQADRPAEAAAQFEVLADLVRAGHEYQRAGWLIKAAACFVQANRLDTLTALSVSTQADRALADWLAGTDHWQLGVDIYVRLKAVEEAARLCEARRDQVQAFKLWKQLGSWERCRALAQEMKDKALEVDVCLEQKQFGEAARLSEELGQLENALYYYEAAHSLEGVLRMLAALGRYTLAAERAAKAQRFAEAGQYYQRAARQAVEPGVAADYWRKAADYYADDGSKSEALACLRQAAQILGEPILEVADINLDGDLLMAQATHFLITIKNVGYGPARQVRVWLNGSDFDCQGFKPVGKPIATLAVNHEGRVETSLKPLISGTPELQLKVTYQTARGSEAEIEFQAFLAVRRPDDSKPPTINIGTFEYVGQGGIRAQDSVVIQRSTEVGGNASPASIPQIIEESTAQVAVTQAKAAPPRTCSNCGKPLPSMSAKVCPHCQFKLNPEHGG